MQHYSALHNRSSPATLAFLIDAVKDNKIPVVFYTEQSNQDMADIYL